MAKAWADIFSTTWPGPWTTIIVGAKGGGGGGGTSNSNTKMGLVATIPNETTLPNRPSARAQLATKL
jgi:hypothetical protein